MRQPTGVSEKEAVLRRHGTLNSEPQAVRDSLFLAGDFFDPRDLLQVKYEMLRRVEIEGVPVSQSAAAFGVSRPTFYQAQDGFRRAGIAGLLPLKRGPRGGHKLDADVLGFLVERLRDDPCVTFTALAAELWARFELTVHPRSIARALKRQEKKPASRKEGTPP